MERDDVLIALARLQATQEQLLIRFDEYKVDRKEMHVDNNTRMDAIEADISVLKEKINWAAGAMALAAIPFFIVIDWVKAKIFGVN